MFASKPDVLLLKAPWCPICPRADALYKEVLEKKEADFEYRTLNVEEGKGLEIAKKEGIFSIPTTLINGEVVFKGKVPSKEEFIAALKG